MLISVYCATVTTIMQLNTVLQVLIVVLPTICAIEDVYYVAPENQTTPCPFSPCHNLSYYIHHVHFQINKTYTLTIPPGVHWLYCPRDSCSDITFIFLPGVHILDTDGVVTISLANNVALKGFPVSTALPPGSEISFQPLSEIRCTKQAGFLFDGINNLLIANLSFTNCGAPLFSDDSYNYSSAILITYVIDLTISQVIVQNSTGYGVMAIDTHGDLLIYKSAFLYNHGTETYLGGNIIIQFVLCSHLRKSTSISIQSSYILHGDTPQYNSYSLGLSILLQRYCSTVKIVLDDVTLAHNGRQYKSTQYSGNLFIRATDHFFQGAFVHITIKNSHIEKGVAYKGGGAYIEIVNVEPCYTYTSSQGNTLNISNTIVTRNNGGGIAVYIRDCTKQNITISRAIFSKNEAIRYSSSIGCQTAGNLEIYIVPLHLHFLMIHNNTFQSGVGTHCGGAKIVASAADDFEDRITHQWLSVSNTHFINNTGLFSGGLCILLNYVSSRYKLYSRNTFVGIGHLQNTSFVNNTGQLGSALYILHTNFYQLRTANSLHFTLEHILFYHNHDIGGSWSLFYMRVFNTCIEARCTDIQHRSTVFIRNIPNANFSNVNFTQNNESALAAEQSNVIFHGNNIFQENIGMLGGAVSLLVNSFMYLLPHANVIFLENHAEKYGGAIYFQNEPSPLRSCILALVLPPGLTVNNSDIMMYFLNNTATDAGDAVYGNYIDVCESQTEIEDSKVSSNAFDITLNFSGQSGDSIVASDPETVCFCEHDERNCTKDYHSIEAFPGQEFAVSVVAVGQRNGTVPGVIHANAKDPAAINKFQISQETTRYCTNVTYTVFSNTEHEVIEMTISGFKQFKTLTTIFPVPKEIHVFLRSCPMGFTLTGQPPKCDCTAKLQSHGFTCNIYSQTIQFPGGVWVGPVNTSSSSNNTEVIVHPHCPFDYCVPGTANISLTNPDDQCAYNRSGILCGDCQPGHSQVFGTSRCTQCSNTYLSLLLVFLTAGLALVFILSKCNINISKGTINGLIFYANIVQMNKTTFFTGESSRDSIAVFIAWLNLDLGIETCFYNGMSTYVKTWLQFAFPLFI